VNTKMDKDWKQLNHAIKSCSLCDGLNVPALGTQNAPGYGSTKSKIIFIGQSLCGDPCINAQIPFTGGSGKLLDQAFEMAGIQKKDVFTTNVVKCHPPNNRKSQDHEIENCTPFLKKELAWISPKLIVCLGKDAWGYFNSHISSPCKKQIMLNGSITAVHFMSHPSYIKRKPKSKQEQYINSIAEIIERASA